MAGKMIVCLCCLLCAAAFSLIGIMYKGSSEPVVFWSGDESLRNVIRDVNGYNKDMLRVYRCYSLSFLLIALVMLASSLTGMILLGVDLTVGVYVLYRCYKRIKERWSYDREEHE